MKTLLIALVLSLIATNCSAIPYFKSNLTTAQYGVFKLLSDKNSTVGITQAQKLNVNISHHQAWNIHGNSNQDYFKLHTPQHKALFTYQHLIKVAAQVDFIADIKEDHHKNKSPVFNLFRHLKVKQSPDQTWDIADNYQYPYAQESAEHEVAKVYPLLVEFSQNKLTTHTAQKLGVRHKR